MLVFDRIKQRDTRFSAPITIYYHSPYGAPDVVSVQNNSGLRDGKYDAILYQYKRGFRPGDFHIGVVDQTSNTLDGPSTRIVVPDYVDMSKPEKGTFPNRTIVGNLAAHLGSPMTSGCTHESFDTGMLLQRAYAKLSEPDLDVGNVIGEMSQTVKMFTNPIIGIGRATRRFNKRIKELRKKHGVPKRDLNGHPLKRSKDRDPDGVGKRYRRFLDSAADAELTYRYGVVPLLCDIERGRGILNKLFAWNPGIRWKGVRESRTLPTTNVLDTWTYWYSCWYMFHVRQYGSSQGQARVYYSVLMPYGDGSTMLGLDWYQLPRLAYNLTAYTFVLDWIVDFDTWLGAIQPKPHLHIYGNSFSWKSMKHHELSTSRAWHYPYGPEVAALSRHVSTSTHYTRDKDLPMSGIPDINWPLTKFERSIDAVSLLWQKMPRPTRVGGLNFGRIG